jgi:hypothetical protein
MSAGADRFMVATISSANANRNGGAPGMKYRCGGLPGHFVGEVIALIRSAAFFASMLSGKSRITSL